MITKGPWGIMHDGPKGDGKPWQACMEAAPGLTIISPHNTEPICRVSGYLQPVEANARAIACCPLMLNYIARRATLGDNEASQILKEAGYATSENDTRRDT